jgi:phosphoadenosine phosphosulfate reductase
MEKLIRDSLKFIKNELTDKGTIFVGFSGGKDSIVTTDLMKRSGIPYRLYYSATGIDPPEIVKFIRVNYPDCKFLRPKKTFWYSILTKNPPGKFSRWCCFKLKKEPSLKVDIQHRVFGIRAEESNRRAKYKPIEIHEKTNHVHYHPIFHWNEGDIWNYIEDNNLLYPALYDEGISRIGCVICPYHSINKGHGHDFYKKRWPKHFKLFERKIYAWFEKRRKQGREMFFDSPKEFIEEWYLGNFQWYKH